MIRGGWVNFMAFEAGNYASVAIAWPAVPVSHAQKLYQGRFEAWLVWSLKHSICAAQCSNSSKNRMHEPNIASNSYPVYLVTCRYSPL